MDFTAVKQEIEALDDAYGITAEQLAEIGELLGDPLCFIENTLKIQDKLANLVPLKFNPPQMRLYQEIQRQEALGLPIRVIILKARQMGFSTATAGLFYHRTVTQPNINTMIIAHKADASTAIFNKNKLFYDLSPFFLQPLRKASNAKELLFENPSVKQKDKREKPGLRSKIVIETAMNKEAGRSSTIHNLHISELAFWPHPEETMTSVMQTVPNEPGTCVIIESTANGVGGLFYEEWQKAERGESPFVPLFFPWYEMTEYTMPLPDDFQADQEELALQRKYHLTDGQLVWRRWCIQANCHGDLDLFHQEYPADPHEAFISSGRPVFDTQAIDEAMRKVAPPQTQGRVVSENGFPIFRSQYRGFLSIWDYPQDGEAYTVGIDVAKGLENGDYSVMSVVCNRTKKLVAEWHGHIAPDLLGEEANLLGRYYNMALLVPESNNHGISTIDRLRQLHYPKLFRRRTVNRAVNKVTEEYGFNTNSKTKPVIINDLGAHLREQAHLVSSLECLRECLTYIYDPDGATNAQNGCYDDRVIALALALYGVRQRPFDGQKWIEKTPRQLYGTASITGY